MMKKKWILLLVILCLTSCQSSSDVKDESNKKEEEIELYFDLEASNVVVEYGKSDVDLKQYVVSGHYDSLSNTPLDPYQIGIQTITYTAYLGKKVLSKELKVLVKDTIAPKFIQTKEKLEIQQGQPIVLSDFIAVDEIDGRVPIALSQRINTHEVGTYSVEIVAKDDHGNTTTTPLIIEVIGNESEVLTSQSPESQPEDVVSTDLSEPVSQVTEETPPTIQPTPPPPVVADPPPAPQPQPQPDPLPVYVAYTPIPKDFMFSAGYTFDSAYVACGDYLSSEMNKGFVGTAECQVISDSNGTYLGYKAIFY